MSPIRNEQMPHSNTPRPTASTPALPADAEQTDTEVVHERRSWTNLSLTQAVGASLAAATAAALGSRLGVVGTVAGAALISLVSVVAGSLYTESLNRTRQKLVALRPIGAATAASAPVPARPVDAPRPERSAWTGQVGRLLLASAGVFLVAALTVTGWELVSGSSLSGDGSTTIGEVARGGSGGSGSTGSDSDGDNTGTSDPRKSDDTDTDQNTPTPTELPSEEPSSTPTEEPTTEPSQSPTPTEPSPSPGSTAPSPQGVQDLSTTG